MALSLICCTSKAYHLALSPTPTLIRYVILHRHITFRKEYTLPYYGRAPLRISDGIRTDPYGTHLGASERFLSSPSQLSPSSSPSQLSPSASSCASHSKVTRNHDPQRHTGLPQTQTQIQTPNSGPGSLSHPPYGPHTDPYSTMPERPSAGSLSLYSRQVSGMPLSALTKEELTCVFDTIEENWRSGHWDMIFPLKSNIAAHADSFRTQRVQNLILWKWVLQPDIGLLAPHLTERAKDIGPSLWEAPTTPNLTQPYHP